MHSGSTISRRSLFACVLAGLGLAVSGKAIAATTAQTGDEQAIREDMARGLDEADIGFSQQRPQLHYNRQRQHGQPPRHRRRRRRPPHWRHR